MSRTKRPAAVRGALLDAPPQDRLDRADQRGSDGAPGEAGDQRDYRDRAQVHATLHLGAGGLVRLNWGGCGLRVREMTCEGPGGSAPLGHVGCPHGRSAEMALRAHHAERDHQRDERAGDPASDRCDDDGAVEDIHLSTHPVENFTDALRRRPDLREDVGADVVACSDCKQEVTAPDEGLVALGR